MILADTSIWAHHLNRNHAAFGKAIEAGLILQHPCVIGELALGNLRNRSNFLADLRRMGRAKVATDFEVFSLIEDKGLFARGIGWVDAHLAAASLLSGCRLWTLDKRLGQVAALLGVPTVS